MIPRLARTLLAWFCCAQVFAAAATPAIWLDVPFVKQERDGCGAASVAMVMQYWRLRQGEALGEDASPAQIQRALYSAEAHGIYASQVERYFQQQGFQTFAFRGEWADLKEHLEKGRPLMVALKSEGSSLHYVVVAGLDSDQGLVLVNDPARRKLLKQDRSSFEREWTAAGKWTLLALPHAEHR
jgi:ABC-type bacteriocin/lantibiotic exporter with double-glycine peptidase domain